tara:strand:+ start:1247 stop:1432 length:186 start_codon:yes stop_codon:yes gene_type:complete
MTQNEAINILFNMVDLGQKRGIWTLQEAHLLWNARLAFGDPNEPPNEAPEPEANVDDTAAE